MWRVVCSGDYFVKLPLLAAVKRTLISSISI